MRAQFDKLADAGRRLSATGRLPMWLGLLLVTLSTGCGLISGVTKLPGETVRAVTPGQKEPPKVDPVDMQERLLRFASSYSTELALGADRLRHGTNAPDPAEILKWKISLSTQTCSIASGPNEIANLLDMMVFVTVTRMSLEEYWQPKVFGDSVLPMLESSRNAETNLWRFAGTVLTPQQQTNLQGLVEKWRLENPRPEELLAARAIGFTARSAEAGKNGGNKLDSMFNLIEVDPLSGLDPAVREIAQTRMFAERALFVTQQMPMLLRWQTELLSINAVEMPTVQQLVTNTTQISASVDRFARVAEQLPGQISTEREEILKALQSQTAGLLPLVNEAHQTLTAGAEMSTSVNTTLTTFDALMKRFGVGETNSSGPPPPPATNAEPFRIQDYTATVAQLEVTARQVTELIRALDQTIASTNLAQLAGQVGPAVRLAQTSGKEVVDYAFWKGILLIVIVLVAALIYRFVAARMSASRPK